MGNGDDSFCLKGPGGAFFTDLFSVFVLAAAKIAAKIAGANLVGSFFSQFFVLLVVF